MNNLDKKDRTLYGKDKISARKRSGIKSSRNTDAPRDWGSSSVSGRSRKKKGGMVKTIFTGSIIFFVLAVLFFLFQFLTGNQNVSTNKVDIEVLGNTFVAGGEELPIQIQITNRNSVDLEYTDLFIEYPDGSGESTRERVSLGTIKSRQTVVESRDIVLFGQQGSLEEVLVTVQYRTKGSNAIFAKDTSHFVTLNSAPIDLVVDASERIVSGQRTTFTISVRANNSVTNENVGVKIDYPTGFRYEESSIDPVFGDNIWSLGDLGAGVEKEFTVTGVMFGEEGEQRAFRFFVGPYTNFANAELAQAYSSYIHSATITRPFIGTQVLIGGIEDEVVAMKATENISVSIKWSNNLATRVDDVVLEVKIEGDIVNESSIQNFNGFYDSNTNTLRWDKSTYGAFASIQPGGRNTLNFSLRSLPLYQSGSLAQDEEITLSISISGKRPTEGSSLETIRNSTQKIIKINSDLYITGDSFFRTGPFNNGGTIPPKVGQETEYTIIWTVKNSANVVSNAKVSTILPGYVTYKNQISPASESVTFDPATRELTWNVGTVARGAGLTQAGEEVAILLGFTPSISQIGSSPLLTGPIELSAKDLFTGQTLRVSDSAISIRLTNDPGYSSSEGRVVE